MMSTNQPTQTSALDPASLRPKQGWRAKLFAKMMARSNQSHDAQVAPYKRRLLADLHGYLLEIGPGAGANFDFFAPDVRWVGVEPNPYMSPYLRAAAAGHGLKIDLRTGYTEALPVAGQSMD